MVIDNNNSNTTVEDLPEVAKILKKHTCLAPISMNELCEISGLDRKKVDQILVEIFGDRVGKKRGRKGGYFLKI